MIVRKLTPLAFILLFVIPSFAQKGFVITSEDSIFHGYMRFVNEPDGRRKVLITADKKKKPRSYYGSDLKYFAYKKDTTAIFQNFYPFETSDQPVEYMEARIVISKGRLKLYHGTLPVLSDKPEFVPLVNDHSVGVMLMRQPYTTYLIKDQHGQLRAVHHDIDNFRESMIAIVKDHEGLVQDIKAGKLNFKDVPQIVKRYNSE